MSGLNNLTEQDICRKLLGMLAEAQANQPSGKLLI
jgi:hypothetical protein